MPTSGTIPSRSEAKNIDQRASLREQIERISSLLLIRLRSLGDSILTLPLLDALHQWRPDLRLDVLIESPFAPVFARHPAVHEVLPVKRGDSGGWTKSKAAAELRKRRYTAVLNLHGGSTSILYSLASGARFRIGQQTYRKPWVYNIQIPPSSAVWQKEGLHTVEHQLSLMRWLDLPMPQSLTARLYPDQGARERVHRRLRRAGVSSRGYFLIHPTATLFTKQWQEERFARVADFLFREHGLPVLLTSAPWEGQVLLNIGQHASYRHHYWSDLDLEELFALIEGTRLFVGNDSGPTHAAAALRKPIVVVWGSSNFQTWHPWGTDFEVLRSDLPCMPCPGYTCAAFGDPKCVRDIPAEGVLLACERMLGRSGDIRAGNPEPEAP